MNVPYFSCVLSVGCDCDTLLFLAGKAEKGLFLFLLQKMADRVQQLNEVFDQLDSDGDGALSKLEFVRLVVLQQHTKELDDIETLFALLDQDGDGKIGKHEFLDCFLQTGEKYTKGGGTESDDEYEFSDTEQELSQQQLQQFETFELVQVRPLVFWFMLTMC